MKRENEKWGEYAKRLEKEFLGKTIGYFKIVEFPLERSKERFRQAVLECKLCGEKRKIRFPQYAYKDFARCKLRPRCCGFPIRGHFPTAFALLLSIQFNCVGKKKTEAERKEFVEKYYPVWKKLHSAGKWTLIEKIGDSYVLRERFPEDHKGNKLFKVDGEKRAMCAWAKFLGVSRQRAYQLRDSGQLRSRIREKKKILK